MAADQLSGKMVAQVLGVMQDGGLPHAGCLCQNCSRALADPQAVQFVAALAIIDARESPAGVWLFDATPDMRRQLAMLAPWLGPAPGRAERFRAPDAIFLTHGHMGHTGGLLHFGPEAMAVDQLPVYGPAGLLTVLRETSLWRPLVETLALKPLQDGEPVQLASDLTVSAVAVPHRDEWQAGTFAYRVQGARRSLLYLPDIDGWAEWPDARAAIASVDIALVDASFFSVIELDGRPPVAHPLVPDTLTRFGDLPTQLVLTHLNHTNPLLDANSKAVQQVREAGASVAYTGQRFYL